MRQANKKSTSNSLKYLLFILIFTALIYVPALKGEFLSFDDAKHVSANPLIYSLSWDNLKTIFTRSVMETYIPLTVTSFAIEYQFFGLDPFVYHLTNLILYLAIVMTIFFFLQRLGFSFQAVFLTTFLFAVHPIHVESVAWVTERKDVLYALFYLLALYQYWIYLETHKKTHYLISLAFGVLSILAKPMAVSLPWILILLDWYKNKHLSPRAFAAPIPFALIIFPIAWVTFTDLSRAQAEINAPSLLIFLRSFSFYIEKFFIPNGLCPIYAPSLPLTLFNPEYLKALIIFLIFAAALIYFRRNRIFIFSILFYLGSIFFFFRYDLADVNIVADRFMFLPSLGLCLIVGAGMDWLSETLKTSLSKKIFAGFLSILFIWFGLATYFQTKIWRNDLTLWEHTLYFQPHNQLAQTKKRRAELLIKEKILTDQKYYQALQMATHNARNLHKRALMFLDANRPDLAIFDLNQAIALDPQFDEPWNVRGGLYQMRGEYEQSLNDLNQALKLNPANAEAILNKSLTLVKMNKPYEALEILNQAIKIKPSSLAYLYRGNIQMGLRNFKAAEEDFTQSLNIESSSQTYFNRARTYSSMGKLANSLEDLKRANQLSPQSLAVLNETGLVYLKLNQIDAALTFFDKTLNIDPYFEEGYNNRALAHIKRGDYGAALKDLNKVIELSPENFRTYVTRGDLYRTQKDFDSAIGDYSQAIFLAPKNILGWVKRAKIYYDTGNFKKAATDIENAIRLNPDDKSLLKIREQIINQGK